jgi:MFS family permease
MRRPFIDPPGTAQIWATRLVFLFCGIAQAGWAPLVPFAKARVHANDQQFGLLLLWFGAGSIIAMPVMGALAGRFGPKQLIRITALCCALGLIGAALASTAGLLGLALAFFGASIGSLDVVMNVHALIVERESGRNLMPSFHAFYSVGGIAGALAMSSLLG